MKADEFRKAMDDDENFKKKRANLFYLSLLLIAIIVSGAEIKEANTLIFKIEFANYENLQWLLIAGILYSMLRYYAYSETHRVQLYLQWASKLINNYRIYYYNPHTEEVEGLIGKAVNAWGGDEPGLADIQYRKNGLFKRFIAYRSKEDHPEHGEVYFTKFINLLDFSGRWKPKDYLLLQLYETKYRFDAWVAQRETLDLIAPYLLAIGALAAFFYRKFM